MTAADVVAIPWLTILVNGLKWLGSGFIVYCILDAIASKRIIQTNSQHPLVGSPFSLIPIPKFILNLLYSFKSTDLAKEGYDKYGNKAFQLIRGDGPVIVLPVSLLDEVSRLPHHIAESTPALERDLLGSFTGVDLILESRLHHIIVQRKLTPRLPLLLPRMEEAVRWAFDKYFPQDEEWTEFLPYQALARVSARLSAEVIVGPSFCENPEWLHIAIEYTESLFRTVVVLRCFPTWMHPFLSKLLPSYWTGWKLLRGGQKLLGPRIQELLDKNDAGQWQPSDDKPEELNVLSWLAGLAKGPDRSTPVIGQVLIMVALATVHTTLLRMVNVLFDVHITDAGGSSEQLRRELLDEIATVAKSGWHDNNNGNPYDRLDKLDSVLRESQRMSPPTTMGMKRWFKQAHTFADGTHVPANTYACMPVFAIENDPSKIPNPERFDGLRAYRASRGEGGKLLDEKEREDLKFSSPTPSFLNFGYGKTACPGRFFASVVVKMVMVKALADYEFKFLPGAERPSNIITHEFLFTWPWNKMLVRRRPKGACPF